MKQRQQVVALGSWQAQATTGLLLPRRAEPYRLLAVGWQQTNSVVVAVRIPFLTIELTGSNTPIAKWSSNDQGTAASLFTWLQFSASAQTDAAGAFGTAALPGNPRNISIPQNLVIEVGWQVRLNVLNADASDIGDGTIAIIDPVDNP